MSDTERSTDSPRIYAHRGGAGLRPENTLAAFRHALDLGADGLELDVHRSRDGVLVISHDPTVDRCSDGSGRIRDLYLEELQQLDAGYHWSMDGAVFPFRGQGYRIPTLRELLEELAGPGSGKGAAPDAGAVPISLDIKDDLPEAVADVQEMLREFGRVEDTIVGSFKGAHVRAYRRNEPTGPTAFTRRETIRLLTAVRLGRRRGRYPAGYLLVPPLYKGLDILTGDIIRHAHESGVTVGAWTINDPEEMQRLAAAGVDILITDRPDLARGT